jgi:hypothetical protein
MIYFYVPLCLERRRLSFGFIFSSRGLDRELQCVVTARQLELM